MNYTVTCVTPTLVGDGQKLAPIDYMVWKDQVNVLDQTRIFRLLAKGPRLEGYLAQLKKATKLDFASWGGFAQNFAGRRIPFESASSSRHWESAPPEALTIPTFSEGPTGPYLPAAALKGALRTGMLFAALRDGSISGVAERFTGERPPRRPAEELENQLVGSRTKYFGASDSAIAGTDGFKVYLVRTATMLQQTGGAYRLGWKRPGGASMKAEESTPAFAEMAMPGSVFTGAWRENHFFDAQEVRRVLRWDKPVTRESVFRAANRQAERQLQLQKEYAEWTALPMLLEQVTALETKLAEVRESGRALLSIGWGAGFYGKSAMLDTKAEDARKILKTQNFYRSAIQSGMPFPKTRRVVFLNDQPATLPGWVELAIS